jgi:hypothetical protein
VLIQVWGRPERCSLEVMKEIARPLMSPPPPGAPPTPGPPPFWRPGVLEEMAAEAGLTPVDAFDATWAYEYEDDEALGRGMVAAGGLSLLVEPEREPELRARIVEALAPHRTPSGGYRLENEFHFLLTSA